MRVFRKDTSVRMLWQSNMSQKPELMQKARKSEEPKDMENDSEDAEGPSDEQLKAEVEKVLDGIDDAFSMKDLLTELREFSLCFWILLLSAYSPK